jgi:hypothetical protein
MGPLISNDVLDDALTPEERLYRALGRAEDRLSRLDERARGCGFLGGWRTRADLRAVLGAMAAQGEGAIYAEDLALHALGSDIRMPDSGVVRADALLRARQKMGRGGEELLSWHGVTWLSGRAPGPPPPAARPTLRVDVSVAGHGALAGLTRFFSRLEQSRSDTPRAAVEEALEVLDVAAGAPALLAAASLVEAWRLVDPPQETKPLGGLLAAQYLRTQRRFSAGLFPFEAALQRRAMPPRLAWAPLLDRLIFWCETAERSAQLELEELARLAAQKTLIERRAAGGRRHNKAPALAALAVERAVLTTEMISRELGISPQGCGQLMKRFDGVLREITGRSAYRVWRL